MALTRYPGFIDIHVHLREPGATHKEDFASGSRAAVAGGFTFIVDMPNNPTPTVSIERLEQKIKLADAKAVCDIGFHYGTDGRNAKSFAAAAANPRVFGLKIYCNHTTGNMLIEDLGALETIFEGWESEKPILVHAEGVQLAAAISLARLYDRRLHVCHISQAIEVELVRRAKRKGQAISAGVCPHHLFLIDKDRDKLGAFAVMKPPLGTKADRDALWEGLHDGTIDLVETDHAPHTRAEKDADPPPFGVPGLETAVGLLGKAIRDKRLPEDKLVPLLHGRAQEIFRIPRQSETFVELDLDEPFTIGAAGYAGKSDWSPFDGWQGYGRPQTVVVGGRTVLQDGQLVADL